MKMPKREDHRYLLPFLHPRSTGASREIKSILLNTDDIYISNSLINKKITVDLSFQYSTLSASPSLRNSTGLSHGEELGGTNIKSKMSYSNDTVL